MSKKINCPNCGKKIEDYSVYCEFCGQIIQKEKASKTVKTQVSTVSAKTIPPIQTTEKPSGEISEKPSEGTTEKPEKEYKWYHRFFRWIGREITLYCKWLCCCNICKRPEDLE